MKSSYHEGDVELLLKDISGLVEPLPAAEREARIQQGTHYCEMLPLEYKPTEKYMAAYRSALENYADLTASALAILAEKIYQKKGKDLVIVSLARAGIPIGILLKRYILGRYGADVKHYAVSIIRGRGIDENAMKFILQHHRAESLQFVDGWIGKGAILAQLNAALQDFPEVDTELAVVSDPANLTELCGTHEDILIPSSCLNATVTGLISRTFFREDVIGRDDFHGAAFYSELSGEDLSEQFLTAIQSRFRYGCAESAAVQKQGACGPDIVRRIAEEYGVSDINFVKPGIGEATRVLLRRIPWKIIINENFVDADELNHIKQLASEKHISCEVSRVALENYKVCGIIKKLSDI